MKQADIWEIELSPTIGAEIQKVRPAVIINDDAILIDADHSRRIQIQLSVNALAGCVRCWMGEGKYALSRGFPSD